MTHGFRVLVRSDTRAERWSMDRANNIVEGVSLVIGAGFCWMIFLVSALYLGH